MLQWYTIKFFVSTKCVRTAKRRFKGLLAANAWAELQLKEGQTYECRKDENQ